MQAKLMELYYQCINELNSIDIDLSNVGNIEISISTRTTKRYGCCKQKEPDKHFKTVYKKRYRKIIRYERFSKHHIEISKWVMDLHDDIIKNTIMHEIIHCFPYCNNHGEKFKQYADIINSKLGYNITRVGNKQLDFQKSNIQYEEERTNKYKIQCKKCGQVFFRQRCVKDMPKKYRCGKCGGKFIVTKLDT